MAVYSISFALDYRLVVVQLAIHLSLGLTGRQHCTKLSCTELYLPHAVNNSWTEKLPKTLFLNSVLKILEALVKPSCSYSCEV